MSVDFQEFIGVKMSPSQRATLERLAEREGCTLSGYIRELIAREAQRGVCGCAGDNDGD